MRTSHLSDPIRRPARRLVRLSLCAALLSLPVFAPTSPLSRPALAQAAPVVGVVDVTEIQNKYTKLKEAYEGINKRKQDLRAQLEVRVFLPEADTKRFDTLVIKPGRSQAESTELEALAKKGAERRGQWNTLTAKEKKSDDDKARIKAFEDEAAKTTTALQAVFRQVDQAIVKEEQETEERFNNQIVKVVGEVAQEKKLLVVISKTSTAWSADSVEITNDVVSRLNRA